MEHLATCKICGWKVAWTTRGAAEADCVVHIFDAHPDVWTERMGNQGLPETPPSAYGRKFEDWERQS